MKFSSQKPKKEKELSLFETLYKLYVDLYEMELDAKSWAETNIKLKEWSKIKPLEMKENLSRRFKNDVKDMLLKFFKGELEVLLSKVTNEHDEERRMNKSAWNSEFAGDFDKKERALAAEMKLLEELLGKKKENVEK